MVLGGVNFWHFENSCWSINIICLWSSPDSRLPLHPLDQILGVLSIADAENAWPSQGDTLPQWLVSLKLKCLSEILTSCVDSLWLDHNITPWQECKDIPARLLPQPMHLPYLYYDQFRQRIPWWGKVFHRNLHLSVKIYLPVKRTSDPESLASEDSRSTTVRPSSFFSTALTERQSCTLAMLGPPPFSFGLSLLFDLGCSWSSSTPGRQIKAIPLCVTAQSRAAHWNYCSFIKREIWFWMIMTP